MSEPFIRLVHPETLKVLKEWWLEDAKHDESIRKYIEANYPEWFEEKKKGDV